MKRYAVSLKRIRQAVRDDRYQFSLHALEEMDEDDLTEEEVGDVLLHGTLRSELTDDPRGVRFVVGGIPANEDAEIEVVCRFLPTGLLRIITVYAVED
jgi:hypothetical protein